MYSLTPIMTVMGDIFYFGSWSKGLGGPESQLYLPSGHLLGRHGCPWPESMLDGSFCPQGQRRGFPPREAQVQGQAKLTHDKGWTVLAFWDRTGRRNYDTSSAFVAMGTFTFDGMVLLAKRHYPDVCKRVGKIRLVDPMIPARVGGSLGLSAAAEASEVWPSETRTDS